jgi:hypothetical protein
MRLVLIHGRAQEGKDSVALQATWEQALDRGFLNAGLTRPPDLEIRFPYYGDTLDELTRQLDTPLVVDVVERGAAPDEDEAAFRGELLAELAGNAGLSDDDIRRNFEGGIAERGPLNWKWVHAILRTLDRSQRLGDLALDTFTRDVYIYLTKRAVRRHIDAAIKAYLDDDPCVVVGHSLGSVVGYNVLRDHPGAVHRYVTVGSPLGLEAIKRRLTAPLAMPVTTRSWHNALDVRDVVSLRPLDDSHFPITPAIVNHTGVDNHTDNRHGIVGYLPDRWVARAIYEALTTV